MTFEHAGIFLREVASVLNDATERVKEKSCYALEAFCENLGDDILPFLPPLLERLTALLQRVVLPVGKGCRCIAAEMAAAAFLAEMGGLQQQNRGLQPLAAFP